MVCGGFACSKNALCALNVVYMLVGLLLIGVAAWGKGLGLVSSIHIIGGVIAVGVFLLLIAVVGLIGAVYHHQVLLFFYMIILGLVFIFQFGISCSCLAINRNTQKDVISTYWMVMTNKTRNELETSLDCCGLFNSTTLYFQDYAFCTAHCKTHSPKCQVCGDKFLKHSDEALKILGGVGLFFSFTEGELLSPCRCDGSVRCTHQPCLIRWISERGSWSCELCYFKYQVLAISTKNPLQWQAISLTVIEKVQIAAIVLGSLFLVASISWLIWSSLSPSAKWQRQDLLFQICYGMYGFMDVVCIGLIVHEGSSVYRIFKRWQAVNQQWKVLNYDKTKDLGGDSGGGMAGKPGPRTSRTGSPPGATGRPPASQRVRTLLPQHCGYTILHLLGQLRPPDARSSSRSGREVVMRVTTV